MFTEYGHTKTYLRKLLESAIEGTDRAQDRVRVFDGDMSEENRALLQEEFNGDPNAYPVRILIATDAAREGVNLQGYCADLFHYDIPWNPGRLEQRNGRIDRTLAFEDEVRCHYFFYPQRAEDEVLRAVVRKVGQIQHDLGSVGAVVFDGIADTLERTSIQRSVLGQLEQEEQRVRSPRSFRPRSASPTRPSISNSASSSATPSASNASATANTSASAERRWPWKPRKSRRRF
ncbi:MAG TPA: helicase-related protein [Polyangiaceae bacterium]|nr:helicase-related protein [Polyangiaceae bacterium]